MNTAKTGITNIQSENIVSNTQNIDSNLQLISTINENIALHNAAISLNSAKTGITNIQSENIVSNTQNIDSNLNLIDTNNQNISTNTGNISTNAGNIFTNATNISTNTAKLIHQDINANNQTEFSNGIELRPDSRGPSGRGLDFTSTISRWKINETTSNNLGFYYKLANSTAVPALRGWLSFATLVSNITFTGQHRNFYTIQDIDIKEGYIVSSTGSYRALDVESQEPCDNILIDESIPIVEYSDYPYDKRVFGVVSKKEGDRIVGDVFQTQLEKKDGDKRLIINSLGEGAIWVCNENGNLKNGDYITTSSIKGIGMKQDSEFLANYSVAKITMDCNFEENQADYKQMIIDGFKCAFVGCTYHCG